MMEKLRVNEIEAVRGGAVEEKEVKAHVEELADLHGLESQPATHGTARMLRLLLFVVLPTVCRTQNLLRRARLLLVLEATRRSIGPALPLLAEGKLMRPAEAMQLKLIDELVDDRAALAILGYRIAVCHAQRGDRGDPPRGAGGTRAFPRRRRTTA